MHSKKHGKSKSKKPVEEAIVAPELEQKEIEKIIKEYAKKGVPPAMIGQKLKDEHNVKYLRNALKMPLVAFLKENKLYTAIPSDLLSLMKKAVNINNHIATNKHDNSNTLRMKRVEAKIWRLTKYYIRKGELPDGWRYDPKQAELIIKSGA